jgi:ribonuclease P protein component
MITRVHRFHGHGSVPALYRRAQTARGPLMNVKYLSRRVDQPYRLAIIVSRKVSKSAVVRNRIRRRLYELARLEEHRMTGPFDIAITVFSEMVAALEYVQLEEQLKQSFIKAGIVSTDERAIVNAIGK